MGKASCVQIGNIAPKKSVIQKLKISDYVFTYRNKDLNNGVLKYYFDKVRHVEYVDGKRSNEIYKDLISFSIYADDEFFNTFTFSFDIEIDMEKLKSFSNIPVNINEYVIPGEIVFDNPYENGYGPIDLYLEEDGYHETANFWVTKIEENKFVFKVSASEIGVFFWFHVTFE